MNSELQNSGELTFKDNKNPKGLDQFKFNKNNSPKVSYIAPGIKNTSYKEQESPNDFQLIRFKGGDSYLGFSEQNQLRGLGIYKRLRKGSYVGSWVDNKPEGVGSLQISPEKFYLGEFKLGLKEGVGKLVSKGKEFLGEFLKGKILGTGELQDDYGIIYNGRFVEERLSGFGTIFDERRDYRFDGFFSNGNKCGPGREITTSRIFFGYFNPDGRTGVGIEFFEEDIEFIGSHFKNTKTGFCYCRLDGYNEYSGQFFKGEIHGRGRLVNTEGEGFVYTGGFTQGIFDGLGRFEDPNSVFVGNFINGDKNGLGYQKREGEESYFGYWKDGLRSGLGLEVYQGKEYKGQFMNDLYEGYGIVKTQDRDPIYARFREGRVVELVTKEKCQFIFKNKNLNFKNFYEITKKTMVKLDMQIDESIRDLDFDYEEIRNEIEYERKIFQERIWEIKLRFEAMLDEYSLTKIKIDLLCEKASIEKEKDLPLISKNLEKLIEKEINNEIENSRDKLGDLFQSQLSQMREIRGNPNRTFDEFDSKANELRQESTLRGRDPETSRLIPEDPSNTSRLTQTRRKSQKYQPGNNEYSKFANKRLDEIVIFILI